MRQKIVLPPRLVPCIAATASRASSGEENLIHPSSRLLLLIASVMVPYFSNTSFSSSTEVLRLILETNILDPTTTSFLIEAGALAAGLVFLDFLVFSSSSSKALLDFSFLDFLSGLGLSATSSLISSFLLIGVFFFDLLSRL